MKRTIILAVFTIMSISCSKNTTLVAYFSATGTTKAVAEKIASASQADLYEITPEVAYTEADLNWRDSLSRSSVEMADKSSRPAIAGSVANIDRYETVYIGFPIWWYTAPTIINTFIEENNLLGKNVKFFATSGSSDISGAYSDFKKQYPRINWRGAALLNDATAEDIESFVNNGYVVANGAYGIKVLSDKTEDGIRTISAQTCREVCSSQIIVSVKEGVVVKAEIVDGCPGNTVGVTELLKGMKVEEAIERMEGIPCGGKQTSCPDQLARVLKLFL